MKSGNTLFIFASLLLVFAACKPEEIVFPDNPVPPYDEISTTLVQNYVNRMYIDLIGREPTDLEMERDVALMEADSLSMEIRLTVMNELMTGTD